MLRSSHSSRAPKGRLLVPVGAGKMALAAKGATARDSPVPKHIQPESTFFGSSFRLSILPPPRTRTQPPHDPAEQRPFCILFQRSGKKTKMVILGHRLLPIILAFPAMGWKDPCPTPQFGTFDSCCAFSGANLTDNHWLGIYCRNDQTAMFGYNYSWYVSAEPNPITMPCTATLTDIRGRIDLDFCVANNGGQLIGLKKRVCTCLLRPGSFREIMGTNTVLRRRGSYSKTCTNCTVAHRTTLVLSCACRKVTGAYIASSLDLSTVACTWLV